MAIFWIFVPCGLVEVKILVRFKGARCLLYNGNDWPTTQKAGILKKEKAIQNTHIHCV